MKKALKELIENAPRRDCGEYISFLVIPTNKAYNGFWGRNGYNDIIVLGYDKKEDMWYRLDSDGESDVFDIMQIYAVNIDVPSEYGCIRICLSEPVEISHPASSILAYGKWQRR